jgi:hypothetical protein
MEKEKRLEFFIEFYFRIKLDLRNLFLHGLGMFLTCAIVSSDMGIRRTIATRSVVFFLICNVAFSQWTFTSDFIHHSDRASLNKEIERTSVRSPLDELDRAILIASLGFLELQASNPHAARTLFRAVESHCEGWRGREFSQFSGENQTRAYGVCALAGAELVSNRFPLFVLSGAARLESDLRALYLGELPEKEKLHLTGRLKTSIPLFHGQDIKASLMAWRVLERVAPEQKGTSYWLGVTLFRQGNVPQAEASFASAESQGDPLALLRASASTFTTEEEASYGMVPRIFSTPAFGQGFGFRAWDDRIGDRNLALLGGMTVSTRGNIWTEGRFHAFSESISVGASFLGGMRVRDYFGMGMNPASQETSHSTGEWNGQGEVGFAFGKSGSVTVGPSFYLFSGTLAPGVTTENLLGGFLQIAWDSRDRRVLPRKGIKVFLRPEAILSQAGVIGKWDAGFVFHHTFVPKHSISLNASARVASGTIPFNLFSDLYTLGVPGVREFRYMGSQALGFWATYRYRLVSWLQVGAFGAVASVANTWSDLLRDLTPGIGVEAELQFERSPRYYPRWELGYFGGQWLFQGGLRMPI